MKNLKTFIKESLKEDHVKAQLKPGSHLWKIFIFSLVGAISIGVLYNFVNTYLTNTRAATETVTLTTTASKPQVVVNEEFSVDVLFSAANDSGISQLDLRMNIAGGGGGTVEYLPTRVQSAAVGSSETNYFDSVLIEQATPTTARVVLSARRPEENLSDRVIVRVFFQAKTNGTVDFTLNTNAMQIVGPGGENVPTTFTVGSGSSTASQVVIGQGPTATIVPTSMVSPSVMPTAPLSPIVTVGPSVTLPPGVSPTLTLVPSPTSVIPTNVQPTSTQPTSTQPTSAQPTSVQPTSGQQQGQGSQLQLRVKFNGIGVNVAPIDTTLSATVIFANRNLSAPIERDVQLNAVDRDDRGVIIYEGTVDLSNIPAGGGYAVYVKGAYHIQKRICDQAPSEAEDGRYTCTVGSITLAQGLNTLDFSNIYQLAGDLPINNQQSGFIDSVDVVFIRSNFNSTDPDTLASADLNRDGVVDTQDYALAVFALSFKYDEGITEN